MRNTLIILFSAIAILALFTLMWVSAGGGAGRSLSVAPDSVKTAEPEVDPAELAQPAEEPVVENESIESAVEPDTQVEASEPKKRRDPIAARKLIEFRGTVVNVETQAGIEGCTASLLNGNRLRAWTSIEPIVIDSESGEPGVLRQTVTDAQGEFVIQLREGELSGDETLFIAVTDGWALLESEHELSSAEILHGTELRFEAKPWPPPSAGNISGWLRAENGSFAADAIPRTDHLLLDLVSTELPAIEMRAVLEPVTDEQGGVTINFLFEDVPRGEYNLTFSSLGNYRWTPTEMRVIPPTSGLEFLRYDLDEVLPLVFEVFDLESGEPVADYEARHIKQTNSAEHGILLHTGPIEAERFPRDLPFLWSVEAKGYSVAYGDERAFEDERERRVARVELKRGWSTRFLIMGGKRGSRPQPLAGADVYLNRAFAGRTDANGGVAVYAKEEPESVEVRYFDWEVPEPILTEKRRSNVTPVVMFEPSRD